MEDDDDDETSETRSQAGMRTTTETILQHMMRPLPLSLNNKTHSHILYNTLAPALALAAASASVSAPAPALAMGLHTIPNQSIIAATQRHSRQRQHRKNTQLRLNQSNQAKHHLNRSILPSRKRAR